jgi:hypothetical protein
VNELSDAGYWVKNLSDLPTSTPGRAEILSNTDDDVTVVGGVLTGTPTSWDNGDPYVIFDKDIYTENIGPVVVDGGGNSRIQTGIPDGESIGGDGSITKIIKITQAEYDLLSPPVPTTLYIIED